VANTTTRRIDTMMLRLGQIRNTIHLNPEFDFDIDHLLPVVETAINAVAEEIDEEMKE
jgi:hypothetical protein